MADDSQQLKEVELTLPATAEAIAELRPGNIVFLTVEVPRWSTTDTQPLFLCNINHCSALWYLLIECLRKYVSKNLLAFR